MSCLCFRSGRLPPWNGGWFSREGVVSSGVGIPSYCPVLRLVPLLSRQMLSRASSITYVSSACLSTKGDMFSSVIPTGLRWARRTLGWRQSSRASGVGRERTDQLPQLKDDLIDDFGSLQPPTRPRATERTCLRNRMKSILTSMFLKDNY